MWHVSKANESLTAAERKTAADDLRIPYLRLETLRLDRRF